MAAVFSNAPEYTRNRGKNTRTTKGFRQQVGIGGGKFVRTPDHIALRRLNKVLEKIGSVDNRLRYQLFKKVENAEHLRFMNMTVMAHVLLFLYGEGWIINHHTFNLVENERLQAAIESLLPRRSTIHDIVKTREYSETELDVMRLRLAATFMRYIIFINEYQHMLGRQLNAGTIVPATDEQQDEFRFAPTV